MATASERTDEKALEGLVYVSDTEPGIRRRRAGKGFCYTSADGTRIREDGDLGRVRALAIPPAWKDVWICADPNGHLQATGRDAKGRKQYLYHRNFREARDNAKFEHLLAFGRSLPRIREAVLHDLALPGLPREKVLATVVHLLQATLIRIGNADYARRNKSYGLTTLRRAHVSVENSVLRFDFKGKSGRIWRLRMMDRRVARIIRSCQELPGQALFKYVDGAGDTHEISSTDVNAYLASLAGRSPGGPITAKDFRTWAATVMMVDTLRHSPEPKSPAHGNREVVTALKEIAKRLGNSVAICRRSYVHPAVMELYMAGQLKVRYGHSADESLSPEERATLTLLRRWKAERDRR